MKPTKYRKTIWSVYETCTFMFIIFIFIFFYFLWIHYLIFFFFLVFLNIVLWRVSLYSYFVLLILCPFYKNRPLISGWCSDYTTVCITFCSYIKLLYIQWLQCRPCWRPVPAPITVTVYRACPCVTPDTATVCSPYNSDMTWVN